MSNYVDDLTTTLNGKSHSIAPATKQSQRSFFDDWEDPYRSYGGYSYRYDSHSSYVSRGTLPKSSVSYKTPKVDVIHPDGATKTYTVPADCDGWFNIAQHVWPTVNDVMRVPVEHCQFSYGDPTFNACVYTATSDYLQARWGRKLDDSDRRWLAAHPLSTDGGVPQEYTATCIDQLVMPYGLRVSRVRLRKGALVLGDSIMGWIQALGCNPFAMADRTTSNAEAAQRMGLPLEQADALWRVEFHDEPLPCSIIGERGWSSGGGVATGALGGHARYLAPRAHAGDWFISVQLDAAVTHLVPPPNPEYVARKGAPTLLLGSITGPDGQLIATKINNVWSAPGAAAASVVEAATAPAPDADTTPVTDLIEGLICHACGNECTDQDLCGDSLLCLECVAEVWQGYSCPHCKDVFGFNRTPVPHDVSDEGYRWECPACTQLMTIAFDDTTDAMLLEITELAFSSIPEVSFPYPDDIA